MKCIAQSAMQLSTHQRNCAKRGRGCSCGRNPRMGQRGGGAHGAGGGMRTGAAFRASPCGAGEDAPASGEQEVDVPLSLSLRVCTPSFSRLCASRRHWGRWRRSGAAGTTPWMWWRLSRPLPVPFSRSLLPSLTPPQPRWHRGGRVRAHVVDAAIPPSRSSPACVRAPAHAAKEGEVRK
jgi:hypothetical protein